MRSTASLFLVDRKGCATVLGVLCIADPQLFRLKRSSLRGVQLGFLMGSRGLGLRLHSFIWRGDCRSLLIFVLLEFLHKASTYVFNNASI